MKAFFTISCLLTISTTFASPAKHAEPYLIEDEVAPLFQRYLRKCQKHNMTNQPVYLRNACREKKSFSSDITILSLDLPSTIQINDIAERILYGDADVVHLRNISANTASHLYELLQKNYTHYIYVPNQERGLFVASKYPLSQAIVTESEDNTFSGEKLDFIIHETGSCCARISLNDLSVQIINSEGSDQNITTPILLVGLPGTLSVIKTQRQQFSSFHLEERMNLLNAETFEILPIRKGGRDNDRGDGNDNRGGGYAGGRIDVEFGPGGPDWSASAFGGYEDGRGNYAEVEVRRNENGTTSASAEAGHENDK